MRHNKYFDPLREPLASDQNLSLQRHRISGPFPFLNPTSAYYKFSSSASRGNTPSPTNKLHGEDVSHPRTQKRQFMGNGEQHVSHINFEWRSRNNRKGRHALVIEPSSRSSAPYLTPKPTSSLPETGKGILRMCTQFPYWDVSYLVAVVFTLGSVLWVLNAFFVYLPLVQPRTEFRNEIFFGGGITAFVGATIFEIGSILLMMEAVNENRAGCFGWALGKFLEGIGEHEGKYWIRPDLSICKHHHTNKKNLVGKSKGMDVSHGNLIYIYFVPAVSLNTVSPRDVSLSLDELGEKPLETGKQGNEWIWFPSMHELKSHYLRELGFLASLSQLFGASVFWISGFTGLPGINNHLSQELLDGIFWTPQVIGGTGFIVSA